MPAKGLPQELTDNPEGFVQVVGFELDDLHDDLRAFVPAPDDDKCQPQFVQNRPLEGSNAWRVIDRECPTSRDKRDVAACRRRSYGPAVLGCVQHFQ